MLAIIIKIYFTLNIFQQAYYGFDLYFKWVKKHFWIINLLLPLELVIYLFSHPVLYLIVFLLEIFYFYLYYRHEKKHLKFTKRVFRISLLILLLCVILILIIPSFIIYMIVDLLLILAVFCLKPIEYLINKKYLNKASKKITNVKAKKIAITGSYAKTSVKNFCAHILSKKYLVKSTPKSYNTPLGISKFINENDFNMTDFIIYEFGARHPNDIKELRELFAYDIAIVTEVGLMHLDTFGSVLNILKTKMDLLAGLSKDGIAILNFENELIRNYQVDNYNIISYGFNYGNYQAKNLSLGLEKSSFDLYVNGIYKGSYQTHLVGRHNILNLLPAIIMCDLFQIDYHEIENIQAVSNRLSYQRINDFKLLLDAYNSNLVGATNALEIVKNEKQNRYIITPGFVECDIEMEVLAQEYAKAINESVDYCFLIENKFTNLMKKMITIKVRLFKTFKEAYASFLNEHPKDATLLIENDWLDVY